VGDAAAVLRTIHVHTGGAGAHRGGDGLIRRYRILSDDVRLTTMIERAVAAPPGLAGGEAEPSARSGSSATVRAQRSAGRP
jgi:N-methylhydantoinase B